MPPPDRTCTRRRRARRKSAGADAEHRGRLGGDARERLEPAASWLVRPFERQRQQQLEPGRARLGLGERQLLAVVVDRRMVGADRIDRAVGQPPRSASRSRMLRSGGISCDCASNQPMSMSHRCT